MKRRYCGPCDAYTNANPCKACGADTDRALEEHQAAAARLRASEEREHRFVRENPSSHPHCRRCHVPHGSAEAGWLDGRCKGATVAGLDKEVDRLDANLLAEVAANARLASQLAGLREALTEVRPLVAAGAGASHLFDGFIIGRDGLPTSSGKPPTTADALLARVDAALHAAQERPQGQTDAKE